MLSGIQFVVDEHGDKTAVQIDLKEHGDLWEDFYDALLVKTRAAEPARIAGGGPAASDGPG